MRLHHTHVVPSVCKFVHIYKTLAIFFSMSCVVSQLLAVGVQRMHCANYSWTPSHAAFYMPLQLNAQAPQTEAERKLKGDAL